MSCEPSVERALRENGARVTMQRSRILAALRHGRGHQTAEQIHDRVRRAEPHAAISLSTVYRTLEALKRRGVVVELDAGGGSMAYEWAHEERPHHHLVCRECGDVRELELEGVRSLGEELRERHAFEPDLRHLSISGTCAACSGR